MIVNLGPTRGLVVKAARHHTAECICSHVPRSWGREEHTRHMCGGSKAKEDNGLWSGHVNRGLLSQTDSILFNQKLFFSQPNTL